MKHVFHILLGAVVTVLVLAFAYYVLWNEYVLVAFALGFYVSLVLFVFWGVGTFVSDKISAWRAK